MILKAVHISRDSIQLTIEGSNLNGSSLILGSSWTPILNDNAGLDVHTGVQQSGVKQFIADNRKTIGFQAIGLYLLKNVLAMYMSSCELLSFTSIHDQLSI